MNTQFYLWVGFFFRGVGEPKAKILFRLQKQILNIYWFDLGERRLHKGILHSMNRKMHRGSELGLCNPGL